MAATAREMKHKMRRALLVSGCITRERAAQRLYCAAALLLVCGGALVAAGLVSGAHGAASDAPRPRRALAFLPVYSVFPYHKVFDCFTIGLQMFPLELAQCIAYTTV